MAELNSSWRKDAPCLGSTRVFFDDVYGPGGEAEEIDQSAFATAIALCAACPVRRSCAVDVLEQEEGLSPTERFGVCAGMTPEQRYSLAERGTLRCGCGHLRDPLDLVDGHFKCPRCKIDRIVPGIPVDGDRWRKRHTTLARKVMSYMVEHVAVGQLMPPPTHLAKHMKCRVQDMIRVYEALTADGTLEAGRGRKPTYRRAAKIGVIADTWQPMHMHD